MTESDIKLAPCPRCKSENVEWSNSRDGNVLEQGIHCYSCDLFTFQVDTLISEPFQPGIPDLDFETTVMKYNAWAATNPRRYKWEYWDKDGNERRPGLNNYES